MRAPYAWATCASAATGHTSPVTFDAPVTATRAGRSTRASAAVNWRTAASGEAGTGNRTTRDQGSRLVWCSLAQVITVVCAGTARASRFSASVVLRVKIRRSSGRAPMNSAMVARACSYAGVHRREPAPDPRCTLAYHGSSSLTASAAATAQGAPAA